MFHWLKESNKAITNKNPYHISQVINKFDCNFWIFYYFSHKVCQTSLLYLEYRGKSSGGKQIVINFSAWSSSKIHILQPRPLIRPPPFLIKINYLKFDTQWTEHCGNLEIFLLVVFYVKTFLVNG